MSSLNLNKVVLCGRLTADPELKQTQSGIAVVTFTLAVNRRFQSRTNDQAQAQQADFISVVAWRQTAEFISKYFKKGKPILVCGQLQTRTWTDAQGAKRYATEVVADELSFVESKAASEGGASSSYTPDAYGAPGYKSGNAPEFTEASGDDDSLPF